jgi:hypothetical protein
MISRSQKLEYALVSSLERDPLLQERLRCQTLPGLEASAEKRRGSLEKPDNGSPFYMSTKIDQARQRVSGNPASTLKFLIVHRNN